MSNIYKIIGEIKKLNKKYGNCVHFIDYIGLIKGGKANNRHELIGEYSRLLKLSAKDAPINLLCQIGRKSQERKRPVLEDLKESGDLEQDADNVLIIHFDDELKQQVAHDVEIIIAKSRDFATGIANLYFQKDRYMFRDVEQSSF
jgi:replicative DNA helicase